MQVEVTTRFKPAENLVILDMALTPRGSGNRAAARRLAQSFRNHAELKPHIHHVTCGSSRVIVTLVNSLALMKIIATIKRGTVDVPGQLALFGKTA